MAGDSPAAILFDAYGNEIALADGYQITVDTKGIPIIVVNNNDEAMLVRSDNDGYLLSTARIEDPLPAGTNIIGEVGIDSTNTGGLALEITQQTLATESTLVDAYNKLDSLESKDFATETTLQTLATEATLIDAYNKLDSLEAKDFATEITLTSLESKDFATETTLQTLATEDTLTDAYNKLDSLEAKDFATEATLANLEAKDFATETTLQTLATEATLTDAYNKLDSLEAKDFATEATLSDAYEAIRDILYTDGIKKITDPLPIGDNDIGRVKLIDAYSTQIPILDGYVLETTAPGLPVMAKNVVDDSAQFLHTDEDGYLQVVSSNTFTVRSRGVVGADFSKSDINATETYYIGIDLDNNSGAGPYKHAWSSGEWINITAINGLLIKEKPGDEWDGFVGVILRIDGTDSDIGWLQIGALHARDTGDFESTAVSDKFDTPLNLEVSGGDLVKIALGYISTSVTAVNTGITLSDIQGNNVTPAIGDVVIKAIRSASSSGVADIHYYIGYLVE